jgi:hypothetical protein
MTMKREQAISAFNNAKSTLKSGKSMSKEGYDNFKTIMEESGFQHVRIPEVDTSEESMKIYDEAASKWCIIIALHPGSSLTWDCSEFSMFDCILRTNDYVGEEFFFWYASPSEINRLDLLEESIRNAAEKHPQTCC